MLLQTAAQGQGSMAEALLLRQIASTVKVVRDMHAAIGEAQRAAQINRTLTEQYTHIRDRLPSLVRPAATQQDVTATAQNNVLDPELAKIVKAAQQGHVTPGTGSPIPNCIDPYKLRTTITPNERDGHER